MSLEMRSEWERCGVGLTQKGVAFICSCGGTFCASCAGETDRVCGNSEASWSCDPGVGRKGHRTIGRGRL
jgi:hypothetical protein